MSEAEELQAQADRLRASGALGRSAPIQKLFDYLLARSLQGEAPKEVEVAEAVFGRRGGFDISQDSTVRVYVHRLRRKLDDYANGPGRGEPIRLDIPKGEYRLVGVAQGVVETQGAAPPGGQPARWMLWLAVGLAALNLVVLGAWAWQTTHSGYAFARRSPAWSAIAQVRRPLTIVVGDYYIFGEMDEHRDVRRLVREYGINSPEDLSNYLMDNPDLLARYVNLDLHYLPVSIAPALRNLIPVLAPSPKDRERIRVVAASQMTAEMLKRNDVVYVGYLSSLGLLRDQVFAGSRFRIGETYDELIDLSNNRIYASEEGGPEPAGETRKDYGYFSTFVGPDGNRIVVVAGTRDVAVMNTAEALSSPAGIAALKAKAKGQRAFEALYEVEAVNRVNLRGELLLVSPISPDKRWGPPPRFPAF